MRSPTIVLGVVFVVAGSGCNPYTQRDGEFIAGAADPLNYPPAYLGTGGDHTRPGRGNVTEVHAFVNNNGIGYFAFPFSTVQLPFPPPATPTVDPLRLVDNGMPYAKVPTPAVYVFDPANPCVAPPGYVYDARIDDVRYDQQGNVFAALPSATYTPGFMPSFSYVPIVKETLVEAHGLACQSIKSEKTLKADASMMPTFDGHYRAWPIIDVAAPVYRVGQNAMSSNGIGIQKLGWYNHYIVAYLDGGEVPTQPSSDGKKLEMVTQNLYYPRSMVAKGSMTFPGGIGFGYDVLDARRTDAGYSPVCAVMTYDTGATTGVDYLPTDVATIKEKYGATIKPASTPYIFCLQVP